MYGCRVLRLELCIDLELGSAWCECRRLDAGHVPIVVSVDLMSLQQRAIEKTYGNALHSRL